MVVLALLFRPWLTAGGWDGQAQADAFGEIHATTAYVNIWSQAGPRMARLTGVWALLAVVAIVVTVFAVVLILRGSSGSRIHAIAATSAVAVAVSVISDVLYLQSKGPELKAMVGLGADLGSQAGLVVRAISGKGGYPMPGTVDSYASAGLTTTALLACVISILSAAAALAQWGHNRKAPLGPAGSSAGS